MTDVVETSAVEPAALPPATNPDLRWYVVHAYSGMEKAVERNILERINRAGMQDKFGRILVPMEEVVEVKNGQKKTTERKFFPGYVLVEMIMDDFFHGHQDPPNLALQTRAADALQDVALHGFFHARIGVNNVPTQVRIGGWCHGACSGAFGHQGLVGQSLYNIGHYFFHPRIKS